jgi:hypothetical protein
MMFRRPVVPWDVTSSLADAELTIFSRLVLSPTAMLLGYAPTLF